MIIFSQQPTPHSRLANSLWWMLTMDSIENINHKYVFPWCLENFKKYLDNNSPWLNKYNAENIFLLNTNLELNSHNVYAVSKKIIKSYNKFKINRRKPIIYFSKKFNCLFLSGKVNLKDSLIVKEINRHKFILAHEPWNFIFPEYKPEKLDFNSIKPNNQLYDTQKEFIESNSSSSTKVGFHIRRGDYKTWDSGKHFYDDNFWINKIKKSVNSNASVWVFTNEVNYEFHEKLKKLGAIISNSSFESDFVRLFFMNKIYGPPSTFSITASFISKFAYKNDCHYFQFSALKSKITLKTYLKNLIIKIFNVLKKKYSK